MAEHFGPYRLEELIGRGGMGEVHRAFDTVRKRTVALKRLRPALIADPEFQARFRAESELAARLRSAHVIPIHDYGEIDGRLFIDMRLVDGEDLADRLTTCGALDPTEVVHVIGQVAGALDSAHGAGLVHRDVKPSNVLLSPTDGVGGRDFAYLVDFGIARAVDGTGGLTGSGPIVGTVDYMAPERFERNSPDHRVDVYALACMLFEALTGTKPFVTDSLAGLLYSHLNAPVPRPSQRRPGISVAFDEVIARGMAKDPDQRHPTCGALAAAAREALAAPVVTVSPVPVVVDRLGPGPDTEPTRNLRLPNPAPGPSRDSDPHSGSRPDRRSRRARGWVLAAVASLAAGAAATGAVWLSQTDQPTLPTGAARPAVMRVAGVLPVGYTDQVAVDPSGSRYYLMSLADIDDRAAGKLELRAYNAQDANRVGRLPLPQESLGPLALSADGRRLAAITWTLGKTAQDASYLLTVVDPAALTAIRTMPLSNRITAIALSPDGSRAYLIDDRQLQVVDTGTGQPVATVPLGADAQDVEVTPDGRSVLVTSSTGLKIVDAERNTVTRTIGLRDEPGALAISPDGRRALVLITQSSALATVDLTSGSVLGAVAAGETPSDVAITADGSQALITNTQAGTVTGLNLTDGTTFVLQVGQGPKQVAISADGSFGLVVAGSSVVRLERGSA